MREGQNRWQIDGKPRRLPYKQEGAGHPRDPGRENEPALSDLTGMRNERLFLMECWFNE